MEKELLQQILSEIKIMQGDIHGMKSDITTIQGDINNMKSDITTMQDDINNMKSDITTMQDDIKDLKKSQFKLEDGQKLIEKKVDSISNKLDDMEVNNANRHLSINGEFKEMKLSINRVEINTAENWRDIAKLKSIK